MQQFDVQIAILLLLWFLLHVIVEGNSIPEVVQHNVTAGSSLSSSSSPWLKRIMNKPPDTRAPGCWKKPWICRQGDDPPRRLCCRNHCVDVTSDVNNCGLCGIRCPFTWHCCRGLCINTNRSRFNCGKCGNRCAYGVLCIYGMCGYAQPLPPRPFPFPKPWPRPPSTFPPKPPRSQPKQPPHSPHPPHWGWKPPAMQWSYFDS